MLLQRCLDLNLGPKPLLIQDYCCYNQQPLLFPWVATVYLPDSSYAILPFCGCDGDDWAVWEEGFHDPVVSLMR
jgi:hypothetical protein